jgi:NAD(P)-dependent dehydrogenase (short-subunit alcohol dehydrogenase family)
MTDQQTALVVGASRSLGLGLVQRLLERGWAVIGTVREGSRTPLHELADVTGPELSVETVDTTDQASIEGLRARLTSTPIDLLLVNAGTTDPDEPVGSVSTEVFTRVLVTNALGPMRVIETLGGAVAVDGTIAVMSSRQGSVSLNTRGGHEVYRASKAALNSLMRSYAARGTDPRTLLLLHPGWVQTELGGEGAPLTVDESTAGLAEVLEQHRRDGGLQFLDHTGAAVAW